MWGKMKKNNTPRWLNDLRARNAVTRRDMTPIPDQNVILETAAQSNFLTKMDMKDAYHQIRIEPESEQYNTITAGSLGAFKIKVMLQGDNNAPATMMRVMNTILGKYIGKSVWVYLDDIVVYSKTYDDHMRHIREVLTAFQNAKFYLTMDKCHFLKDPMPLLGHVISKGKITPPDERIKSITDWETPRTKKQLQGFLGVVNYISKHIPHIATLQAPLTALVGKADWIWTDLQDKAFMQVKSACETFAPITPINYTAVANGTDKVYLYTDASMVGMGAVLCHGRDPEHAENRIAAMHSRKFTPTQQQYTTTDQELLAIVDALSSFQNRLFGIKFTVFTDHKPLEAMTTSPIRNGRHQRWMNFVQLFDFDIKHIKGTTNVLADALSRIDEEEEEYKKGTAARQRKNLTKLEDNAEPERYFDTTEQPLLTTAPRRPTFKRQNATLSATNETHAAMSQFYPLSKYCTGVSHRTNCPSARVPGYCPYHGDKPGFWPGINAVGFPMYNNWFGKPEDY